MTEQSLLDRAKTLKANVHEMLEHVDFVETYVLTPSQADQDILVRWAQLLYSVRRTCAELSDELCDEEPTQATYDNAVRASIGLAHFLRSLKVMRAVDPELTIPEVSGQVESETNLDLLGKRYEALMHVALTDKVYLTKQVGDMQFWLKAFLAKGEKECVDDHWYYTQVPGTLVLELGVNTNVKLTGGNFERFTFLAHKEGGYLMRCPSGMRLMGMWQEWYDEFLPLMAQFEQLFPAPPFPRLTDRENEISTRLRELYYSVPNTSKAVKKLLGQFEPESNRHYSEPRVLEKENDDVSRSIRSTPPV